MDFIWSDGGTFTSTVAMYGEGFGEKLTTTNSILLSIKDAIAGTTEKTTRDFEHVSSDSSKTVSENSSVSNGNSSISGESVVSYAVSSDWENALVKSEYFGDKSKLNTTNSVIELLKSHDYSSTFDNRAKLYQAMQGSGTYTGSASQNQFMLKTMKNKSYKKGSRYIPQNETSWTHENELIYRKHDGGLLIPLSTGDMVFTEQQAETLWQMTQGNIPQNVTKTPTYLPNKSMQQNSVNVSIGDINMYEVNDPETFAIQLKDNLLHNTSIKKIIQADTLGQAMGKNSFTKFNY